MGIRESVIFIAAELKHWPRGWKAIRIEVARL